MANVSDYLIKYNSQGGIDTAHSGYSPQVQKLAATINKQKGKLGDTGGGSPGILGRIFDTISRPLYTVANTVDSVVQNKNPLEGAWRGLSGQDKTTFDKVLGDMGMTGGFQRALLGFGLDVVADPTTYIGAGLVKDAGVGVARKIGTEAVLDVGKEATQKVAREAVLDASKEALSSGSTKLLNAAEKRSVGQAAIQDHLATVARTAEDKALQEGRGRVFLKFMGKEVPGVIPKPAGEALYGLGTKAAELAAKSPSLVKVGQAVRPVMNFKHGTNDLLRESIGHAFFDGEEYIRGLKTQFGHLGEGERKIISHAIESGEDLSKHVVSPVELKMPNGTTRTMNTLEDYKSLAIDKMDALHQTEAGLGMVGQKSNLVNYVPHIYQTGDREAAAAFKAERKKLQSAFLKSGETNPLPVVKTLKQAAEKGLKPKEDILESLAHRAVDSFREQGHVRFANAVENEFGVNLGKGLKNSTKGIKIVEKKPITVKTLLSKTEHPSSGEGLPALYHGTSKKIESLGDKYSSGSGASNLFGPGFYTTDSKNIASQYIKKGTGDSASMYHVNWLGDKAPNMIDLNSKLTPEVKKTFAEYYDKSLKNLDYTVETDTSLKNLLNNPNATGEEIYKTVKKAYGELGYPKYEIDDALSVLSDKLESKGYDGFVHQGGSIGKESHGVRIFFDPTKAGIKDISKELPKDAMKIVKSTTSIPIDTKSLAKKMGLVEGKGKYLSDKGIYFHPDVAKTLQTVDKVITDPAAGAEITRLFDKVQNAWKLNMTALNPGHHIRNFAGDVFLNFEDGVVNAARYTESAKILKNWRENPAAISIQVGEKRLNAQQVMDLFSSKGGKSGFFRTELASSGIKPVEKIREMAEVREDWTRLAHFIDVLKKEGKNVKSFEDLDKVASTAGKRVRKFNIDYGDLTPFERNGLKRVAPFYTWMRKNLPVQLETLALNPGKINAVPKFLNFLNSATGQQGQDPSLFGLNLTPLWLRQMASVRIAGEGQGRNGVYWNPSVIPFMDIGQYSEGGTSGVLSSLLGATSPFIRTPVELATGRSLLSGGPLQDTGMGYAGQNLIPPSWTRAKDIATGQGDMTDTAKLLGLSLQNVGDPQMKGELRRQQDPLQVRIKNMKAQLASEYAKRQNAKSA